MASKSMKVLQIVAPQQIEMIEMAVPEPQGRQVRLKRFGIVTCNAFDMHIYNGKPYPDEFGTITFPQVPGYPGHEWVAVVDKVGPEVNLLKVGDWVCGPGGRGEDGPYPGGPGGYAPYSTMHETRLIKVPQMEVPKLAPFEMATCVAANALPLKQINAIAGRKAGVMGLGPAGIIAAQWLRAEGATQVIGLDVDARRREYALAKGIVDRAINPIGEDGKALPFRNRDSRGAPEIEIGMDCAGVGAAISYLMDHTRYLVSLFAVQHDPVEYRGWGLGHHSGLIVYGAGSRTFEVGEYAQSVVASNKVDLSLTISHTMRLDEYPKALELIRTQQALKVMFTFDERDW
jgi:threonine dehydrogenase-like Zn-dependent dehydrogenase